MEEETKHNHVKARQGSILAIPIACEEHSQPYGMHLQHKSTPRRSREGYCGEFQEDGGFDNGVD
jgi:hypothetical protein